MAGEQLEIHPRFPRSRGTTLGRDIGVLGQSYVALEPFSVVTDLRHEIGIFREDSAAAYAELGSRHSETIGRFGEERQRIIFDLRETLQVNEQHKLGFLDALDTAARTDNGLFDKIVSDGRRAAVKDHAKWINKLLKDDYFGPNARSGLTIRVWDSEDGTGSDQPFGDFRITLRRSSQYPLFHTDEGETILGQGHHKTSVDFSLVDRSPEALMKIRDASNIQLMSSTAHLHDPIFGHDGSTHNPTNVVGDSLREQTDAVLNTRHAIITADHTFEANQLSAELGSEQDALYSQAGELHQIFGFNMTAFSALAVIGAQTWQHYSSERNFGHNAVVIGREVAWSAPSLAALHVSRGMISGWNAADTDVEGLFGDFLGDSALEFLVPFSSVTLVRGVTRSARLLLQGESSQLALLEINSAIKQTGTRALVSIGANIVSVSITGEPVSSAVLLAINVAYSGYSFFVSRELDRELQAMRFQQWDDDASYALNQSGLLLE